jgi:membrane-bound metal-dependent hydrolase YbcI (DUF457 family)
LFAINHAATALLIKRRFPQQPIVWLLLSVQFMEVLWVLFNLLGVERTTTDATVQSTADIHLGYMPYSHSVATVLGVAVLGWLVCRIGLRRPALGLAIAIGITSHLLLDLVTHAPDVSLAPGIDSPKLGLGLYSALPLGALVLEVLYGVFCWWVYKGGRALLTVIVLFNLANLSLLSPQVTGPESMLANQPTLIAVVILLQIAVTLFLVGFFSQRPAPAYLSERTA